MRVKQIYSPLLWQVQVLKFGTTNCPTDYNSQQLCKHCQYHGTPPHQVHNRALAGTGGAVLLGRFIGSSSSITRNAPVLLSLV